MASAKSAILAYHSLDYSGSAISLRPELFAQHMDALASSGTPVVPLSAVRSTPGSVALTFDDGYRSLLEHAIPVLAKHRFPATVFVVSRYCGKNNDWPTQPPGIPVLPLMDWADLREIARQGIALGAHTATHPRLTGIEEARAAAELRDGRREIEDRTSAAVDTFAYPYGDSNARVRELAAREFRLACGTRLDYVSPASDLFELPRIDAYYFRHAWAVAHLQAAAMALPLAALRWIRAVRAR
jgi:peptidoglycan/xylan/chitin deacetylase (PgdA/CDA1 family)